MKTLVIYFSRSGKTKMVAHEIAKQVSADIEELNDPKMKKSFALSVIFDSARALRKKTTDISYKKDPKNYDIVILCTPVWAGTLVPAVYTYLKENPDLNNLAFVATFDGSASKTFENLQKASTTPIATLGIKKFNRRTHTKDIKKFCEKLKNIQKK